MNDGGLMEVICEGERVRELGSVGPQIEPNRSVLTYVYSCLEASVGFVGFG